MGHCGDNAAVSSPIHDQYARRTPQQLQRYSLLRPEVWRAWQERQRTMLRLFADLGWSDFSQRRVVEVGCGAGGNLLELLRMGFMPRNLKGIELLPGRHEHACEVLPSSLRLILGDALSDEAERLIPPASQDIVMQFTVFSSVLDDMGRLQLADAMWRWVRPGGGVLWYDFVVNNPFNDDVRGVPVDEIRRLFPQAVLHVKPITLAPPVARWVCRKAPWLYPVVERLPGLRTHVLVWAQKPLEWPASSAQALNSA